MVVDPSSRFDFLLDDRINLIPLEIDTTSAYSYEQQSLWIFHSYNKEMAPTPQTHPTGFLALYNTQKQKQYPAAVK